MEVSTLLQPWFSRLVAFQRRAVNNVNTRGTASYRGLAFS
jgi:hypothetical protein